MDEIQIKTKIQELIGDYKANYYQYKRELEANTKTKLVEPLFNLLGWTTKDFVKNKKLFDLFTQKFETGYKIYGLTEE